MKLKPYLLLATLSGCTPYSESFDCPPGQGVGCKSLSVINQMVEEGKLPIESVPLERVQPKKKSLENSSLESNSREGRPVDDKGLIQAQNAHPPHSLTNSLTKIPPAQDTHMRVWLAAYEDQGIIHEPSTVYVALKNDPSFEVTKENAPQAERFPMRNN